jgi:CHASE2 domain-containing sensor protein
MTVLSLVSLTMLFQLRGLITFNRMGRYRPNECDRGRLWLVGVTEESRKNLDHDRR